MPFTARRDLEEVRELDSNPLLAFEKGCMAVGHA